MAVEKYSKPMIILHWLIALMLFVALYAGMVVVSNMAPDDPEKVSMLTAHAFSGIAIGTLMLIRLIVRFRSELPPSANPVGSIPHKVALIIQWSFYGLVFLMVLSGISTVILSGALPALQSGQGPLPNFHDTTTLVFHSLFSKLLMLMILLHIAAVVKHRIASGESLMQRMSLRQSK